MVSQDLIVIKKAKELMHHTLIKSEIVRNSLKNIDIL